MFVQDGFLYLIVTKHKLTVQSMSQNCLDLSLQLLLGHFICWQLLFRDSPVRVLITDPKMFLIGLLLPSTCSSTYKITC
jgi:hypothetical protein